MTDMLNQFRSYGYRFFVLLTEVRTDTISLYFQLRFVRTQKLRILATLFGAPLPRFRVHFPTISIYQGRTDTVSLY